MAKAKLAVTLDENTLSEVDRLVRKARIPQPQPIDRRSGEGKDFPAEPWPS